MTAIGKRIKAVVLERSAVARSSDEKRVQRREGRSRSLEQAYKNPMEKQTPPTSVVASEPCAIKFGQKANSASEKNPPEFPYNIADQQ